MKMAGVLGHDTIRNRFAEAIRNGRLGHAFLLVGQPGIGKKLFAQEMAKALLCENSPGPAQYCGQCVACALTAAGTHPDLFTAAKPEDKSEFPIESVRDLCNQLALSPTRGLRKVAIVDDAEDFNPESANAFLKTLEEPAPGSALFLIAVTEESQLPTIRSRCQTIRFQPLPPESVKAILQNEDLEPPVDYDWLMKVSKGIPGRAIIWADPQLQEFRRSLAGLFVRAKPSSATLAELWIKVAEEAGKELVKQRARTVAVQDLLLDWGEKALKVNLGVAVEFVDTVEAQAIREIAQRYDADEIMEWMETLTQSQMKIERYVQVPLVIEWTAEQLVRA